MDLPYLPTWNAPHVIIMSQSKPTVEVEEMEDNDEEEEAGDKVDFSGMLVEVEGHEEKAEEEEGMMMDDAASFNNLAARS